MPYVFKLEVLVDAPSESEALGALVDEMRTIVGPNGSIPDWRISDYTKPEKMEEMLASTVFDGYQPRN